MLLNAGLDRLVVPATFSGNNVSCIHKSCHCSCLKAVAFGFDCQMNDMNKSLNYDNICLVFRCLQAIDGICFDVCICIRFYIQPLLYQLFADSIPT